MKLYAKCDNCGTFDEAPQDPNRFAQAAPAEWERIAVFPAPPNGMFEELAVLCPSCIPYFRSIIAGSLLNKKAPEAKPEPVVPHDVATMPPDEIGF